MKKPTTFFLKPAARLTPSPGTRPDRPYLFAVGLVFINLHDYRRMNAAESLAVGGRNDRVQ